MKTLKEFTESLSQINPPDNLSSHLKALWRAGKDDWETAHNIVQDLPDKNASWIHAYLHRKEGDLSNANYWYSRAGKTMPATTLKEEWENIVSELLKD